MASLLQRWFGKRSIQTIDDYIELYNTFYHNGIQYGYGLSNGGVQQTLAGETTELAPSNFAGLATHAYAANGPVFACELVRMLVFSSIRFEWQRLRKGQPSDSWANDPQLRILQRPFPNGTTQDFLISTILDADLAGNAYWTVHEDELVRLRPDWVDIVLEKRIVGGSDSDVGGGQLGWRKVGFVYTEGGRGSGKKPVGLLPEQVIHFSPLPDPLASYRGMSWLTPVLREIQADQAMTRHQRKFFDNGATPNLIIKYEKGFTLEKLKAWKELFDEETAGIDNAYKTLHLAAGADPVPVGANLKEIDFSTVRNGGETRIAAAAGVPPVIAGFAQGLESATYSNYSQARRRFADATMHPLWENIAGSIEHIFTLPDGGAARLWYDATDIPFLREDEKDAAEIQKTEALTMNTLITAGFDPDSVVEAIRANGDWKLLRHTGLTSVQLIPPGVSLKPKPNGEVSADLRQIVTQVDDPDAKTALTRAIAQVEAAPSETESVVTNGGSNNGKAC